ncbi:hypothetical protein M408DRAFT_99051 [Serendipita vermifera MAFF 305830]|uniref:PNPLA domain-containing protein n=1 Tax=Serendipita vermifera MAFF 305830 TaxID=933852 RepID=A0A0C3BCR5_SERVB|nr:hypothetical protein M408DRAFT_99051 [Serendipita vermifera MAFF 305830]
MASKMNLKLVSLDDGGIRGFSQLEIMNNIMHRLNWEHQSDESEEPGLPCEHFDLIGGSGTGGLIAILLGKLRMSVEEASDTFCTIVEHAYTPSNLSASDRTDALRKCMEDAMRSKRLPVDLQLAGKQQAGCPCFVVASPRTNASSTLCFRSYPIRSQPSSTITVIDATLATCATQPDFASVHSGPGLKRREYISSSGAVYPAHEVISEAHLLFGGDATVASLLSMGTGHPGIISFPQEGGEAALLKTMREMMHDCEQRSQEMEQRIGRDGIYSRLSVEQGLQNHHSAQTSEPEWIVAQTEDYLNLRDTSNKLDLLVKNIRDQTATITLDRLSTSM